MTTTSLTPTDQPAETVSAFRLGGTVDSMHGTYGHILGDDGRRYFFIPTFCDPQGLFVQLRPKVSRVTFRPKLHDTDTHGCPRYRAYVVTLAPHLPPSVPVVE